MRFFEFKLPEPGTDFSAQIEAELNNLSNIVDKKPEVEDKVNAGLQKLIKLAKTSAGPAEKPAQPTPAPQQTTLAQPPASETKETMFDEAAAAMSMTDSLVSTLMKELTNVVDNAKKKAILGMLKNLVAEAKQEEFSAGKDIINQLKSSANILAAKISGTLEALKQQYDEQISEGDPQAPKRDSKSPKEVNKELIDLIEGIFNKPISQANTIQQRDAVAKKILSFMKRCEVGVIDLKAKIAAGKGIITSGISGEDQEILDMLENALMKAKPGKTAGNWGPGELGLAILGTPVNKGSKGDLDVGGEMIELKASQNPKKGGRFGSTALQRGTDGKADYTEALRNLLTTAGYNPKQLLDKSNPKYIGLLPAAKGKTKIVSHLSFGQTFIEAGLNPKIKGRVSPADTLNFLEMVAISCITKEYKYDIRTKPLFQNCVNGDSTINLPMFNLKYSEMLYGLYQKTDDVGKIMVMNPLTGSYFILGGPKDLAKAAKNDGQNAPIQFSTVTIDFSDSQGKASPQIGI
jgi:ferritin